MKKYLTLLFFFILSFNAISSEWSFEKKGEEYYLKSPDGKQSKVMVDAGEPKFIKAEELDNNHLKIIYFSGDVGTSQIIKTYRAAIYKKNGFEFLGDYPHRYEGGSGMSQPDWSIKNGIVTIKDEDQDESYTIKL